MMLPSGNDAAQTLGIFFGLFLLKDTYAYIKKSEELRFEELDESFKRSVNTVLSIDPSTYKEIDSAIVDLCLKEFYKEMNKEANRLALSCNTNYWSAHGMHNDMNYSCAHDIAKLSYNCMKNPSFREIVRT